MEDKIELIVNGNALAKIEEGSTLSDVADMISKLMYTTDQLYLATLFEAGVKDRKTLCKKFREFLQAISSEMSDKGCLMAHKGEYRIMEHDAALAQKRKN